jgi:hypothetical protein
MSGLENLSGGQQFQRIQQFQQFHQFQPVGGCTPYLGTGMSRVRRPRAAAQNASMQAGCFRPQINHAHDSVVCTALRTEYCIEVVEWNLLVLE